MHTRLALLSALCVAAAGCDSGPPPPASGSSAASSAAPAPAPAPAPDPVADAPAAAGTVTLPQGLRYTVPPAWEVQQPSSSMRAAQYGLPAAEGESAAAECVVFFFGLTQGGGVEDNIQRWIGQMSPAAGAEPVRDTFEINGCTVHTLDVEGDYSGGPAGGGAAGARMLAAIVETEGGKFFFKAIGPVQTIGAQAEAFQALCKSVSFVKK